MSLDDPRIDERQQRLKHEILVAFNELSLSHAQRQRLHDRFRQRAMSRHTAHSSNWLRDQLVNGSRDQPNAISRPVSRRRRAGFSRGLERAGVVLILLLFIGGLFVARTLIPSSGSSQPGATGQPVSAVYAVQSDASGQQLLPLDPATLADQSSGPITLSSPEWSVSADGSTTVTVEYDGGVGYIVVRDRFRGAERARFKSPVQGLLQSLQLNRDGSRLLVERQMEPSQWAVIDTVSGNLLMTLQTSGITYSFDTPMHAEDVRLSPDGDRVYRFIFNNGSNTAGPAPLRVVGYSVADGRQTGDITLTHAQLGTWQGPVSGEAEPITYFQQPGIAISPDSQQIAVVNPDGQSVTLIDAAKLTVERTISVSRQTSFIDRLAMTLGLAPQAAAKNLDGLLREAVYSPEGNALYVWGERDTVSSSSGMHGLGLERIDLNSETITAQALPDGQFQQVTPSPDGRALYVLGFTPSSTPQEPVSRSIWLLDAQTLQIEANRPVEGVYSFALVTGEARAVASTSIKAWEAPMLPLNGSSVDGAAFLLSTGSDQYELDAIVSGGNSGQELSWIITHGTCQSLPQRSIINTAEILRLIGPVGQAFAIQLSPDWLKTPLLLVGEDTLNGTLVACADVPIKGPDGGAPLAVAPPAIVPFVPEPKHHVQGQALVWPTHSGNMLLRLSISGPPSEMNLMYFIASGTCAKPGKVLWRNDGYHDLVMIAIPNQWMTQSLIVGAWTDGGGPRVACGDLPVLPLGIPAPSPASGDPGSMALQLSQMTVKPGDVITRTITGAEPYPNVTTSSALVLEVQVNGSWRDVYYLAFGLDSYGPSDWIVGPQTAITAVAFPPTAAPALIPNVPPGTYRLRQDLTYGPGSGDYTQVTLYATITVVAP